MRKGIHYDGKTTIFNQIANYSGKIRPQNRSKSSASLLGYPLSTRFYLPTAFCHSGSATILSDRLSRYCSTADGINRPQKDPENNQNTALHHPAKSPATAAKKRAYDRVLTSVFQQAKRCGLIDDKPEVSIDSTGLESSYVSRHFLMRAGKRTSRYRRWTKLTVVGHSVSHLIAGATVSTGPSNDCPYFAQTVPQAVEHLPIYRLLGDGGYDSDDNHRLGRQELGIRSTVIAINERYYKGGPLVGGYRRQMKEHFPKLKYRQRWQVESIFSRFKRRLGYALRGRSDASRGIECLLRVLTYNLMILLLTFYKERFFTNCSFL